MRIRQSTVNRLLEDQSRLNDRYNVPRWDEALVSIALMTEFAEMMNEIQTSWKNWKRVEDNRDAAKVEMIDCVHFMLSLILLRREIDSNGRLVQLPRVETRSEDFLVDVSRTVKGFLSAENSLPLSLQKFVDFVDIMTEYLGMDEQEFIRYFETKMQINIDRVDSGYAEGQYKGKETEHLRFA